MRSNWTIQTRDIWWSKPKLRRIRRAIAIIGGCTADTIRAACFRAGKHSGAILWQLQQRDPGEYDIAGRAPDTVAKFAMKAASANDVTRWMAEHDGLPPFNRRAVTMSEIMESMPGVMRSRLSMRT